LRRAWRECEGSHCPKEKFLAWRERVTAEGVGMHP